MATIKPTALAAYFGGSSVNIENALAGYSGGNRVVRYTFKSPSTGASAISITCTGSSAGSSSWPSLRFHITESSTSHKNAGSGSAYTGTLSKGSTSGGSNKYSCGSRDIILKPNTTYYLWIFPASTSGWCYWNKDINNATFTTSGSAGLVYIGNEAYQAYVGNGKSWDVEMPYTGNGTGFDLCS